MKPIEYRNMSGVITAMSSSSSILSGAVYFYLPVFISAAQAPITLVDTIVSVAVAFAGIAMAYWVYRRNMRAYMSSTHRLAYAVFHNSEAVNAAYSSIAAVCLLIAEAVARFDYAFDRAVYGAADYFVTLGKLGRSLVNGQTNVYALAFVLGIAVIIIAFLVAT